MAFSSVKFLFLFLPLFLVIYYAIPYRLKNVTILIFSLVMVFSFDNLSAIVLFFSLGMNYSFGRLIHNKGRFWAIALGISMNVALLSVFKYHHLLTELIFSLVGICPGPATTMHMLSSFVLPVGISFYTFRLISYLVDIHRKKTEPEYNFIDFAVCFAFFPLLLAGPIARYIDLKNELRTRRLSFIQIALGIERFIIGLGLKVLIANALGTVADQVFSMPADHLSTPMAWLGLVSYTMQIFFDFAGYTGMAIGLGMMTGFTFPENFNYPYISKNIREFWRRWHMTLSSWLRDYVFLPVAYYYSKKWKKETYFRMDTNDILYTIATLVTFVICGFWHGSSLTFLLWGLYYGFFMIMEQVFLKRALHRLWIPLQHLYAMVVIMGGWVLFRSSNMDQAVHFYDKLIVFSKGSGAVNSYISFFTVNRETFITLVCAIILSTPLMSIINKRIIARSTASHWIGPAYSLLRLGFLFFLLLISLTFVAAQTYNPFIYFRF